MGLRLDLVMEGGVTFCCLNTVYVLKVVNWVW